MIEQINSSNKDIDELAFSHLETEESLDYSNILNELKSKDDYYDNKNKASDEIFSILNHSNNNQTFFNRSADFPKRLSMTGRVMKANHKVNSKKEKLIPERVQNPIYKLFERSKTLI